MTEPHATDAPGPGGDHDAPDHGDHGHSGDDALGPVDVSAWGSGALGVAVSIVIALCLALATSGIG